VYCFLKKILRRSILKIVVFKILIKLEKNILNKVSLISKINNEVRIILKKKKKKRKQHHSKTKRVRICNAIIKQPNNEFSSLVLENVIHDRVCHKVVNFILFCLYWLKYFIPNQKTEQKIIIFISFQISVCFRFSR